MPFGPFYIVDTTLREGEQFVHAYFTTDDKVRIAMALDRFGVEYIELTNPATSPKSLEDVRTILRLGLRSKVVVHIRCHRDDALRAIESGAQGISVFLGVSPYLQRFSHGLDVEAVIDRAAEVLSLIRAEAPHVELRFSTEDTFRSRWADIFRVYLAIDRLGVVHRLGVADTVGVATPWQVYTTVRTLRRMTRADIEFHGHDDTGCAVANALAALRAGATHIDTTVLGIGERVGITPLGGFIARLYTLDRDLIRRKYNLAVLPELDRMVAEILGLEVPFNNYVTGLGAFAHKAGVHTKAVLHHPAVYEVLDPADFGLSRSIAVAHRLTGWHAIKLRADELGLGLTDEEIRQVTAQVKALADERPITIEDVDEALHRWVQERAPMPVASGGRTDGG
ncbi:MAG: homocitrate synthase [Acidobacteria bacterium]|nr:homocitrate synthase [Acidobacteriota bacterium]MDW7985311.1 homocitrate synthase [Acidobacteriota bacterium]